MLPYNSKALTRLASLGRSMSHTSNSNIDAEVLKDFHNHLQKSKRIVALLGAGLSASCGIPTFRGAGGLWRTHDAMALATPEAFESDPGFVWQFYSYRRHIALNAKPNRAHLALAELARKKPDFLTLSQNIDGLSPRVQHPAQQLKLLHGDLFDIKCWDEHGCGYIERKNFTDPIVPALALPTNKDNKAVDPTQTSSNPLIKGLDISDASIPIPSIPREQLPQCPSCKRNLLRPGVVWFGEALPRNVMSSVTEYFMQPQPIDLMLVIGTSGVVFPAATYVNMARQRGARVGIVNIDAGEASKLTKRDWMFAGDAAVIIPELLEPIIGTIGEFVEAPDRTAAPESFEANTNAKAET